MVVITVLMIMMVGVVSDTIVKAATKKLKIGRVGRDCFRVP